CRFVPGTARARQGPGGAGYVLFRPALAVRAALAGFPARTAGDTGGPAHRGVPRPRGAATAERRERARSRRYGPRPPVLPRGHGPAGSARRGTGRPPGGHGRIRTGPVRPSPGPALYRCGRAVVVPALSPDGPPRAECRAECRGGSAPRRPAGGRTPSTGHRAAGRAGPLPEAGLPSPSERSPAKQPAPLSVPAAPRRTGRGDPARARVGVRGRPGGPARGRPGGPGREGTGAAPRAGGRAPRAG